MERVGRAGTPSEMERDSGAATQPVDDAEEEDEEGFGRAAAAAAAAEEEFSPSDAH